MFRVLRPFKSTLGWNHEAIFGLVYVPGSIVPTATIYQNLKYIANDPTPPPNFPVAALTSENRDTWASMRHVLEAIPGNEEVLKLIDSAIFVLCLDDHEVNSIADVTRTFLHGDGKNRSATHNPNPKLTIFREFIRVLYPRRIWIGSCWFLWMKENQRTWRETSEQMKREPKTNSTQIWYRTRIEPGRYWWEASAQSPLRDPCSSVSW